VSRPGDAACNELGVLYVVATPIGNLGDLTGRAVETLRACDLIVAEDTRRTRALLAHLRIVRKPLEALHARSGARDVTRLSRRLVGGESVALVTDAGTPGVSDPGEALVRAAVEAGVKVVPVPGPSAVLAALTSSGLAGDGRFRFLGFFPRGGTARREAIALACATPETVVLFEAPGRTSATLRELADATPGRSACVARELTKVHEEIARGRMSDVVKSVKAKGEITIVVSGVVGR